MSHTSAQIFNSQRQILPCMQEGSVHPYAGSNFYRSCRNFNSVQTSAYLLSVPRLQHFHHDTSKRDEVCSGICHTWRTVGLLVYHCLFICVSSFLSLGWHQSI